MKQNSPKNPSNNSSIGAEIAWLLGFLVVFAIALLLLNIYLVPHHFNDKVADTAAGVIAAILYVVARRWAMLRTKR
ncbi:MAG: hypothetical protein PXZ07_05640 [Candidatus Eremiobacteraeota bacterium]|nr:hypothetical protein [Candidatus Eremiobacteraeota bacterium]